MEEHGVDKEESSNIKHIGWTRQEKGVRNDMFGGNRMRGFKVVNVQCTQVIVLRSAKW